MLTYFDLYTGGLPADGRWLLTSRYVPEWAGLDAGNTNGLRLAGLYLWSTELGYDGLLAVRQAGRLVAAVHVPYEQRPAFLPLPADLARPVEFELSRVGHHFDDGPLAVAAVLTDEQGDSNMTAYEALTTSVVVVGTEKFLLGPLNSAVTGVMTPNGKPRKAVWLSGDTANTGTIILRLGSQVMATIDGTLLTAAVGGLPLDIDIPAGQVLTVSYLSTSGTGAVLASVGYVE